MVGIPFIDYWQANVKLKKDTDHVDRLNHFVTSLMLLLWATVISVKLFVGSPIHCIVKDPNAKAYVEDYCIMHSYFVPITAPVEQDEERRNNTPRLLYYSWSWLFLAIQALLCHLVCVFWRSFNFKSGLKIDSIIQSVMDSADDDAKLNKAVEYLQTSLGMKKDEYSAWKQLHYGFYVTCLYIFTKFLYLANLIGQMAMINLFLGSDYTFWGVQILRDLLTGKRWNASGQFPRVAYCDYDTRASITSDPQPNTVQCCLMINELLEKIFIFVWLWLFMLAIATLVNLAYYGIIMLPHFRRQYYYNYIRHLNCDDYDYPYDQRMFATKVLPLDASLLLRLIELHAGDYVAKKVAVKLWICFNEKDFTTDQDSSKDGSGGRAPTSSALSRIAAKSDPAKQQQNSTITQAANQTAPKANAVVLIANAI